MRATMRIAACGMVLLVLLGLLPHRLTADDHAMGDVRDLAPAEQHFFDAYKAAVNGHEVAGFKHLVCQRCLAAITEDNRAWIDERLAHTLSAPIPDHARVQMAPIAASGPLLLKEQFDYPERPTHWLQISWSATADHPQTNGAGRGPARMEPIAHHGEHWCLVIPIPTPATLAALRRAKVAREQFDAETDRRVAALRDPFLSELRALLAAGRTADAIHRYVEREGVSSAISQAVIERLLAAPHGTSSR